MFVAKCCGVTNWSVLLWLAYSWRMFRVINGRTACICEGAIQASLFLIMWISCDCDHCSELQLRMTRLQHCAAASLKEPPTKASNATAALTVSLSMCISGFTVHKVTSLRLMFCWSVRTDHLWQSSLLGNGVLSRRVGRALEAVTVGLNEQQLPHCVRRISPNRWNWSRTNLTNQIVTRSGECLTRLVYCCKIRGKKTKHLW